MTITRAETERPSRISRDETESLPPPPPPIRGDTPATLAGHVERQPASTEYLAFLANVSNASTVANAANVVAPAATLESARDAAVQAKLDALRDAFSGPYVVAGAAVSAHPMFRMTTHVVTQAKAAVVDALGARAGVRAPYESRVGQGTPQDLVKITQALIDGGRLPPGPGDVAARIRKMQWDHGIGVDCAGYSKQALAACSTRTPKMHAAGMESFRDVDGGRGGSFAKVSLEKARPGDLITPDAPEPGGWGHNVVVYSHVTADAAKKAALYTANPASPDLAAFLASPGPHHVLEVDSSWGAGTDGAECGGYRRDTWIYDAATRTWGSFTPGIVPAPFVTAAEGPADDVFHGAYRVRS